MVTRRGCVDGVADRSKRDKDKVEQDLKEMLQRADGFHDDGQDYEDALRRAGLEMQAEAALRARKARREAVINERTNYLRRRDYRRKMDEIEKWATSPGGGEISKVAQALGVPLKSVKQTLRIQGPRLALESEAVGVNLSFFRNRDSAAASQVAERIETIRAFVNEMEHNELGDLFRLFGSREFENQVTDELFEVWRGDRGKPGITKNAQALAIAKLVAKHQQRQIDKINSVGGWTQTLSGYIGKTSHDPNKIRADGPEKWSAAIYNNPGFDAKRSFGTSDRQKVMDALRQMWTPMAAGDHFDYGAAIDDPIFPSLAKKYAAHRELHWKTAEGWRAYNRDYGLANPTKTITDMLVHNADRIGLMRHYTTQPAKGFEGDISYIKDMLKSKASQAVERARRLEEEFSESKDPAKAVEIKQAQEAADLAVAQFKDVENFEPALRNRFAQIDGTSKKPVKHLGSDLVAGWMSAQRMAKLKFVVLTHFAGLPAKMNVARYWNASIGERLGSVFTGLTRGMEGSDKRELGDMFGIHQEAILNNTMSAYDVADAPPGYMAQWETLYWRLTGAPQMLTNQRTGLEAVLARQVGKLRGKAWADVGPKEKRALLGFGIDEPEWKAFNQVEWTKNAGRDYLVPSDIMNLSDAQVKEYIESRPRQAGTAIGAEEISRTREELALSLASAYHDYSAAGMVLPDARTRAMVYQKNFEPGTPGNTFMKLILQFKMWPAAMISRAWGREIYGTIGDNRFDRISGLLELLACGAIFGTAEETVRKELKGQDGIQFLRDHPVAALVGGLQRSGMGTLMGDYLLGQYDRHGFSAVASLAGPTIGQIDDLMTFIHAEQDSPRHPWRERGAIGIKIAKENNPFNTWLTESFFNYLLWYKLQDWLNPGYTARMERRMKDQQGQQFWLSPQNPGQSLANIAGGGQ